MKVVHINTSDMNGGAAIAAHRFHLAMLEQGVDSKMLVMSKLSDEINIETYKNGKAEEVVFSNIRKLINKIPVYRYKNRKDIIFSPANIGVDISKNKLIKDADIIHLHWIVGGYLSLKSLENILKLGKKTVWTLHDSWAFTGGCHVRYGCEKYRDECGCCHMLNSKTEKDLSRKVFLKKKKIFEKYDNLKIITPSSWLEECAENSKLLKKYSVDVIPNVLDESIFKHLDKDTAKKILNLDTGKKYICFGALNAISDAYKGWDYLKKALEILDLNNPGLKNNLELLVFGVTHSKDVEELPFKTRFLGRIYDECTLALIYNSADIFVGPSLEEAFGQTYNESIHCGTPALAFANTGSEDIIEHKINGYLAEHKNYEDLAYGIKWSLDNLTRVGIENEELDSKKILKKILEIYGN